MEETICPETTDSRHLYGSKKRHVSSRLSVSKHLLGFMKVDVGVSRISDSLAYTGPYMEKLSPLVSLGYLSG